ncbi:MAG: prolyl oligopeptidase family serine peptidase [Phycisphaerales bacterium]|nr:prolyl oligopeptidase family serine peptidase [Phycisphaerales bacterium]
MHTALIAFILVFQTLLAGGMPQPEEGADEVRVHKQTMELNGVTYAWAIMIPPGAEEGGPAILFLHGAGECGTDGEKNLAVGLPKNVREHPEQWPFVLIVPQKPTRESEWEDHAEAVLAMLDEVAEKGLIDPNRLAITGLSQGGHGTIMLASMHPERFRAAAPVCGYVDRRIDKQGNRVEEVPATPTDRSVLFAAKKLVDMPVWLVHGGADPVVPVEESRALSEALTDAVRRTPGSASKSFIEHDEVGHDVWLQAYADPELVEWFVEHTAE